MGKLFNACFVLADATSRVLRYVEDRFAKAFNLEIDRCSSPKRGSGLPCEKRATEFFQEIAGHCVARCYEHAREVRALHDFGEKSLWRPILKEDYLIWKILRT